MTEGRLQDGQPAGDKQEDCPAEQLWVPRAGDLLRKLRGGGFGRKVKVKVKGREDTQEAEGEIQV